MWSALQYIYSTLLIWSSSSSDRLVSPIILRPYVVLLNECSFCSYLVASLSHSRQLPNSLVPWICDRPLSDSLLLTTIFSTVPSTFTIERTQDRTEEITLFCTSQIVSSLVHFSDLIFFVRLNPSLYTSHILQQIRFPPSMHPNQTISRLWISLVHSIFSACLSHLHLKL